jgi:hypothetical protein
MKLLRLLPILLMVFALTAAPSMGGALDTQSGQADSYSTPKHNNMSNMGMEAPPEAFVKKPIPKEGMTLFNLPWNVPWWGIFLTAFLIFFPFLLIIGMAIYKSITKKEPAKNQ